MSEPCFFTDWHASTIVVRGNDRVAIVQNLSTADVTKFSIGQAGESFLTNVKGHVAAHSVVCVEEEQLTLVLLAADAADIAAGMDKYIFREDAQITVAAATPLLIVGSAEEQPNGFACTLAQGAWIDFSADTQRLQQLGYRHGTSEDLDRVRVANCWPLAEVDFQAATLPQELDRDQLAISFTKGCYLGQETIARLDAMGHVNKQIVRVVAPAGEELAVGTQLMHNDKEVGKVTTAADLGEVWAGLAMVRRECNSAGSVLDAAGTPVTVEHRQH